jgi:large subunit ribosomal protein L13e
MMSLPDAVEEYPAKALVARRIQGVVRFRRGRGFSLSELRECGLTVSEAREKGLEVDELRRTKHEENIKILKGWLELQSKPRPGDSATNQVEKST